MFVTFAYLVLLYQWCAESLRSFKSPSDCATRNEAESST